MNVSEETVEGEKCSLTVKQPVSELATSSIHGKYTVTTVCVDAKHSSFGCVFLYTVFCL